jgi:hypothetical protein
MTKLLYEILTVGITTSIIGIIISTILMLPSKNFSWKTYTFWPQIMLSYFLTGCIIHILFEISGGNKWYCKNGNACSKR